MNRKRVPKNTRKAWWTLSSSFKQLRPPARLVHPCRILHRELEARGWEIHDLAKKMGCSPQIVSEIVAGKKQITPKRAAQLGTAFGTSPEFWNNLARNYRLALKKENAVVEV